MGESRGRPRTLFLDHVTVPGGAELALVRMLRADPDWNAVVLLPPEPDRGVFADLPVPVRSSGIAQRFGASTASGGAQAGNAVRLAVQAISTRLNRSFRTADLVVANTTRSAAYGALAARASRVPFVVHVRDMADAEALGDAGAAIMRRIVLPRADGIVADTRRALASALPFADARIPAAVIPSASGLALRPPRPRSDGPLVVGMLARLDPWKGQELLLDAFARAFGGSEARLQLAGSAPFGHEEFAARLGSRAAELGIRDQLDLLGHVDDVDALLDRWHIGVQASLRPEPLGQNVLQYLAAGCATVVADEGGPAEWVDDGVNGLRVAPRDADALAAALRRLGGDPDLRVELGASAAQTPRLQQDAAISAEHRRFYREVLASRRARRHQG